MHVKLAPLVSSETVDEPQPVALVAPALLYDHETVTFDRRRHEPIGPPIADGARVVVVRPGYAWKTADENVLVARAVVQD